MAKSYCNLLYHLVFSTKNRDAWFEPDARPRVHEYLGGAIKGQGGIPLAVGGTADHVHLFCKLRQDKALSDVLREVKASSSAWIHDTFRTVAFAWQEGYGAFTVSPSQAERLRQYVAGQEAHHRRTTYQQEFLTLLQKHGVAYDERYLWD